MKKSSANLAQLVATSSENTAPRWRSMASAPTDGRRLLGVISFHEVIRIIIPCEDGRLWRSDAGFIYEPSYIKAWAPIPEWTGEVSE